MAVPRQALLKLLNYFYKRRRRDRLGSPNEKFCEVGPALSRVPPTKEFPRYRDLPALNKTIPFETEEGWERPVTLIEATDALVSFAGFGSEAPSAAGATVEITFRA